MKALLLEIAAVLLPLLLVAAFLIGRFAAVTVVPALLLLALAVLSGAVRTVGLALVGAGAVLQLVMVGVDRLAEYAPSPRSVGMIRR